MRAHYQTVIYTSTLFGDLPLGNRQSDMDSLDTLHRRARLRELVGACFGGIDAKLIAYIESRTQEKVNQGEISSLQKDNGPRSFGEKRAIRLASQVGLVRKWFELPLGASLDLKSQANENPYIPEVAIDAFSRITHAATEPSSPPTLEKSLAVLAAAIEEADDLARDQVRGLLERLSREPERGSEIGTRICATLRAAALARAASHQSIWQSKESGT
jgi:hypothetical protein